LIKDLLNRFQWLIRLGFKTVRDTGIFCRGIRADENEQSSARTRFQSKAANVQLIESFDGGTPGDLVLVEFTGLGITRIDRISGCGVPLRFLLGSFFRITKLLNEIVGRVIQWPGRGIGAVARISPLSFVLNLAILAEYFRC
jgi:hypothetical protein